MSKMSWNQFQVKKFIKDHLLKIKKDKKCRNIAIYIWNNKTFTEISRECYEKPSEKQPESSVLALIHHKHREKPVFYFIVIT